MSSDSKPVFQVNVYTEPVIVQITGRATYMNSAPIREFFRKMMSDGKAGFIIDFRKCTGMDSTFLGIIAGVALELKRKKPTGELLLCGLENRNHELITNLGLHRITTICDMEVSQCLLDTNQSLPQSSLGKQEKTKMILEAHKRLIDADESNRVKFQDVISLLKSEL